MKDISITKKQIQTSEYQIAKSAGNMQIKKVIIKIPPLNIFKLSGILAAKRMIGKL
jgi:hypothetical protein